MDFKPFKIGKYLLLEKLATGGMAEVYRAKASGAGGFEKQLAIKRILPNYSSNEEFRRMFEYEARLSSMLTHANIVQIYDFVKSNETYLLAMEYVDGKNLRQFVNKARKLQLQPPVEFGVYVINEVCKGLEYAHKKKDDLTQKSLNIIHRDMSPQNIMMSYEGAVKIVDFGIAKAKDRVDETRSGVIKGKFGYMSPEQANGEPVDHKTDIFSTGIILYELLTGKRLFAADNDMATLKQIQECVVPAPSRSNPKVTAELEKILMKALTKDLTLRYQTAGNFHRALQEFLGKYHPQYTQKEVGDVLMRTFAEEIAAEKRRFEQIYRQSIPFSQGSHREVEDRPDGQIESNGNEGAFALDDEEPVTASQGAGDRTAVTYVGDDDGASAGWQDGQGNEPSGGDDDEPSRADNTQIEPILSEEEASFRDETQASVPTEERAEPSRRTSRQNTNTNAGSYPTGERTLVRAKDKTRAGAEEPSNPMKEIQTGSWDETSKQRPTRNTSSEPKTPSGITLSGQATTGARRRERSISAVSEMSGGRDNIQLRPLDENASIHTKRTTQTGRARPQPFRVDEQEPEFEPRSKGRPALSLLALLIICAGGWYLYQSIPIPIATGPATGGRELTVEPTEVPPVVERTNPPSGTGAIPVGSADCGLEVTSDPPGARVVVDGADRGATPTTVLGSCGSAIDIVLQLDGFDPTRENVVLKNRSGRYVKALKKIPTGTLKLELNFNAQLYIDGKSIGEALANQVFERELPAGRRYKVRFVNELQGIDELHEFGISENLTAGGRLKLGARPR